jgi:hypothetical protein
LKSSEKKSNKSSRKTSKQGMVSETLSKHFSTKKNLMLDEKVETLPLNQTSFIKNKFLITDSSSFKGKERRVSPISSLAKSFFNGKLP